MFINLICIEKPNIEPTLKNKLTQFYVTFLIGILVAACGKSDQPSINVPDGTDTAKIHSLIKEGEEIYVQYPDSAFTKWNEAFQLSQSNEYVNGMMLSCNDIWYIYFLHGDMDSALYFCQLGDSLATILGDEESRAVALNNSGLILQNTGRMPEAMACYSQSLRIREEMNDESGLAYAYANIGPLYLKIGDYVSAIDYMYKALQLWEEQKDTNGIAYALNNIGATHLQIGHDDVALQYFYQSFLLRKELKDKFGMVDNLNNIAFTYQHQGKLSLALKIYRRALSLSKEVGDPAGTATNLNNIGIVFSDLDLHHESLPYFHQSLDINQQLKDRFEVARVLMNIGAAHLYLGDLDSAMIYTKAGKDSAEQINNPELIKQGAEVLNKIYLKLSERTQSAQYISLAHDNLELSMIMGDTLLNREKYRQAKEIEIQYEVEKKEAAIEDLQNQRAKDKSKRTRLSIVSVSLLVVLVLLILILRARYKRKKVEHELVKANLEKSKQELEFKEKQLTTKTLNLIQKNKIMEELKDKLKSIDKLDDAGNESKLKDLMGQINYSLHLDQDWEDFKLHFEQINTNFFPSLKAKFPDLTEGQLRLCALIRLKLNIKEAASVLNLSPNSVRIARVRLRKKLNLKQEDSLEDYLMNIG